MAYVLFLCFESLLHTRYTVHFSDCITTMSSALIPFIDPCIVSPCQHDGQCLATSHGRYVCECKGTGYTGSHCEKGVIHMPSRLTLRVGETVSDIHIDARPEKELLLTLSNHRDAISVMPSPIRVSGPTVFRMTVSKRGVYDLTFNITGRGSTAFDDVKRMEVRAEDVFYKLKLRNGVLPVGCFWYQLKFQQYQIWFLSTSPWYERASVVLTTGIVMLVHDSLQLPIAIDGLEIRTDQEIRLRHVVSLESNYSIVESNVSCDALHVSDRDMQDLRQTQAILKTLFVNIEPLIPFNIQLLPKLDNKITGNVAFEPQILSARALQRHAKCKGAPAEDGKLFVTFQVKHTFYMKIQQQVIDMEGDDVCVVGNMHVEGGYTVSFLFSDEAGSKLRHVLPLSALEARSGLVFTVNGFSVSRGGLLRNPFLDQEEKVWNGHDEFSYRYV